MNSTDLPPGVSIYQLSPCSINYLWNKMKDYDPLFTDETRWNFTHFEYTLTRQDTLCLSIENGILILTDIVIQHMAQVHACFWDHKLSMRLQLLQDCIIWVFAVFGFVRLEAIVPAFSRGLRRFLRNKLNFTEEGTLRQRMRYHKAFNDVVVYSLLREEISWV